MVEATRNIVVQQEMIRELTSELLISFNNLTQHTQPFEVENTQKRLVEGE